MTTPLASFIITLCAVIIIGVLLNKNKQLNQTKMIATNTDLTSEVKFMINSDENYTKIVKKVREKTGLGLVEAKQYVDNVKKNN
ncbi:ribosomal protein L7/L12 [Planococcus alpniumensis]|uniref:ribosomal protein L7/L12 n=1 Tax=Planococcus alpniumensis TaxID=2708345 RepID=UPI001B8B5395|nr:ribosomal protein L7/L12 [Planococcus sp. MSAK28401]